ncbi:MAG TPA: Uma2 family endonuclease, partial [Candidatus Brocadiaceae bacterium]
MHTTVTIEKKKKYTVEDYDKLPEGAPYQLIKGGLVMTPSPIPYHQEIILKLGSKLLKFIDKNRLGKVYIAPIDVYFSDTDVYQPDIIFISKMHLKIIGEKRIDGAPDIVIEVLSPSSAYYDLRLKKDVYEQSGVTEYWIIDPVQKKIEMFFNKQDRFELITSSDNGGSVSSTVLKGFTISLQEIFG